jgi:hypothetical protein
LILLGCFVALLVVFAGTLLIVGGASFLLLGFDIVMTERGSAMTLGGVIALSSGVIAVGIGFALMRLSQILRVLDTRGRGIASSAKGDRPVVPLVTSEPEPRGNEPVDGSAAERAVLPVGAAVLAGGAALAVVAANESTSVAGETREMVADTVTAEPQTAQPVNVPPDLEAELARALSDVPAAPPPVRSFADGLSEVLAKANRRKDARPIADPVAEEDVTLESSTAVDQPTPPATLKEDPEIEPASPVFTTGLTGGEDIAAQLSAQLLQEPSAAPEAVTATEAVVAQLPFEAPEPADADSTVTVVEGEQSKPQEDPAFDDLRLGSSGSSDNAEVLGTYNVGGRTYSMYSDGSVEAITESGIQRFKSMDDLRQHLAKS